MQVWRSDCCSQQRQETSTRHSGPVSAHSSAGLSGQACSLPVREGCHCRRRGPPGAACAAPAGRGTYFLGCSGVVDVSVTAVLGRSSVLHGVPMPNSLALWLVRTTVRTSSNKLGQSVLGVGLRTRQETCMRMRNGRDVAMKTPGAGGAARGGHLIMVIQTMQRDLKAPCSIG